MKVFDFIGIGFGPANIALAIQLEENGLNEKLNYRFIECREDSVWQSEMLLSGTDIQNIPIRDLITPINPQSHYSFINYLHKNGKYFKYCGLGLRFPLRQDYAMYINWCASHFKNQVQYKETVLNIKTSDCGEYYSLQTDQGVYYAKSVVMATGRSLYIPSVFDNIPKDKLITINNFSSKTNELSRDKNYRFAVVGASQSAVEILLELTNKFYNSTIHSYIRKFSFVMRDSSPFSYEVFSPGFIDEYYHADEGAKFQLNAHLRRTNYSSVDIEALDQLNMKIYEESLNNNCCLEIKRNTEIIEAWGQDNKVSIKSKNLINYEENQADYDFLVVCTGFKDLGKGENNEQLPPLLKKFANQLIIKNIKGVNQYISENYELFFRDAKNPVYLNGLCESSHGMGDAGALGLVSIRANRILNSLVSQML